VRCSKAKSMLSAYADGVVNPAGRRKVDEHLTECPSCRGLLEDTMQVRTLLQGLSEINEPPSLASRIDRIPWEFAQEPRTVNVFGLGMAVAAAAVVLLVVISRPVLFGGSSTGTEATVAELPGTDAGSSVMEVRQPMLPEERPSPGRAQWVSIPMTRGVPLEGSGKTQTSSDESAADDRIWREVRRVSLSSRRSF
jgi:anti-sigma factor RsiW